MNWDAVWTTVGPWVSGFLAAAIPIGIAIILKLPEKLVNKTVELKFAEKLERTKSDLNADLEGVKARLALLGQRGSLSNQKEYEAIIVVWEKFVEAVELVEVAAMSWIELPDFARMTNPETEAYLRGTDLSPDQQKQIMAAADKALMYGRTLQYRDIQFAAKSIHEGKGIIEKQGIFIPHALEQKLIAGFVEIEKVFRHRRSQFMFPNLPRHEEPNLSVEFLKRKRPLLDATRDEVRKHVLANLGETKPAV